MIWTVQPPGCSMVEITCIPGPSKDYFVNGLSEKTVVLVVCFSNNSRRLFGFSGDFQGIDMNTPDKSNHPKLATYPEN